MFGRPGHICTVSHGLTEVPSQLCELQIPVRAKWRNWVTCIAALKLLEMLTYCLSLIGGQQREPRGFTS